MMTFISMPVPLLARITVAWPFNLYHVQRWHQRQGRANEIGVSRVLSLLHVGYALRQRLGGRFNNLLQRWTQHRLHGVTTEAQDGELVIIHRGIWFAHSKGSFCTGAYEARQGV